MSWFKSNLVSTGPLRSARSYFPSDNGISDASNMMTDLVLSDIQKAITDYENKKENDRLKTLEELHQPDYSWLMDWKLKAKKTLSFKESAEIENLCSKLKPYEWKEVITLWRSKLNDVKSRDEIIDNFRDCASHVINERIEKELKMIQESDEPTQQMASARDPDISELSVMSLNFPGSAFSDTNLRRYADPSDMV